MASAAAVVQPRWCEGITVNYNAVGVFSDHTSLPNLGVAPDDGGYNSILMENYIYVENQNEETLYAQLNWWGTQNPDPNKFIGPVEYEPWLNEPPEGHQSGGKIEVITESNLYDCQPNPFSSKTTIRYQIAQAGNVRLNIYDPSGRLVKTLINGEQKPGSYSVVWDGRNRDSQQVTNGVYFYRFSAPGLRAVKKVILSR
ncbi:MAG: FlgD immunoglobulin-like domain containing protein [candidate division WOR-3 bacterium]